MFREKQKQEMKLLKQELDLLPRDNRKEKAQQIRETKQIEMEEKVMTNYLLFLPFSFSLFEESGRNVVSVRFVLTSFVSLHKFVLFHLDFRWGGSEPLFICFSIKAEKMVTY